VQTIVSWSLLFAKEETVGPSNLRLAAGVGVVAAVVMVGGPTAAVAIADPGGSHSNRSDHRDREDVRDGWKHGGDDRNDGYGDNRDGGYGGGSDGGYGADRDGGDRGDRDGSYGGGGDRNPWGDGNRWSGDDDQKSTSGSDSDQSSTSGSSRTSTGGSTASLAPQTSTGSSQASTDDSPLAPQTPADGPGSDTVSGADGAGPPIAEIVQPRVVVGNGRSPGIQPPSSEPPRWSFVVPEIAPAPPPPPPIAIPPAPSDRVHPQRLIPQLGIAPSLDWTDPLWGLAGLIVIPAAGAVLGYRQAKAARAVEVLTRT
jgi:hypothetical protein